MDVRGYICVQREMIHVPFYREGGIARGVLGSRGRVFVTVLAMDNGLPMVC